MRDNYFSLIFASILLSFTRFFMLGNDIVNRDAFHFKNWSYVFMQEFETGNWDKLFVTIQPGILTIYSNIVGFKFLYYLKDKLGIINAEGKDFELLLHMYQKVPQSSFIVILSLLIFYLVKKMGGGKVAITFLLIYSFEPFFIINSRFIQTDALQSILIVLSLLLFIYYYKKRNLIYIFLSAAAGGLGFIEKSSTIALLPFLFLVIICYNNLTFKNFKSSVLKIIKEYLIYVIVFFTVAFVLFPSYWAQPGETFLRMTLDAYIHGVGGVNLDSYDFDRPDNLGNPISFSLNFDLLKHLFFNHTEVLLIGIMTYLFSITEKLSSKKRLNKDILVFALFAIYYLLIIQVSNLKMSRYLIVCSLPLALVAAYSYTELLKKLNANYIKFLWIIISVYGLFIYFYLLPDWGAYSNSIAFLTNNDKALVGGTGGYRLGEYLSNNYGDNERIVIADYTSLYLFYPGNVFDYSRTRISSGSLVVLDDDDFGEIDYNIESLEHVEIDEYVGKGNVTYKIYRAK